MNTEKTGTFIAELRKEKGMKQAELAELLHVSDKAVSRWETGRGFPDITNLEALSECLGVSAAELIRGERMPEEVSKEDLRNITSESISLTRTFLNKNRYANTLLGFITGLMIVIIAVVHLASPIYIKDVEQALTIEELTDGRVVAVLNENVSGYDIDHLTDPDSGEQQVFIGCYQTLFDRWLGRKHADLVLIGDAEEVGRVFYSPTGTEDKLIYGSTDTAGYGGVVTLPRLVYNEWLVIGLILSVGTLAAYLILRRKHKTLYADRALNVALMFAAFTISIPICLFGKMDEVYNASYYFSGILLLAVVIYLIFRIILYRKRGI